MTADKLIVVGAADGSAELRFESGHKVTVTHGTDAVQYATTRTNETADALLKRMGISVGPMEMVKVDVSEPEIFIEIAASFTYYETLTEPAEHATVYTKSYKVPKGRRRSGSRVWTVRARWSMRSFTPTASWSRVRRSPSRTIPASPSTPTSAPSSSEAQAGDTIALRS